MRTDGRSDIFWKSFIFSPDQEYIYTSIPISTPISLPFWPKLVYLFSSGNGYENYFLSIHIGKLVLPVGIYLGNTPDLFKNLTHLANFFGNLLRHENLLRSSTMFLLGLWSIIGNLWIVVCLTRSIIVENPASAS